jgi:hypothetical protein
MTVILQKIVTKFVRYDSRHFEKEMFTSGSVCLQKHLRLALPPCRIIQAS